MTMQELNQLYQLRREIQIDAERLAVLETKATHITASLSGQPGGGDGMKLERYAAAIADLRDLIETKRLRCVEEQARLEAFIITIPDSLTRQVFTLRFVQGMTWQQVANRTNQGSRESPRIMVKRYLRDLGEL